MRTLILKGGALVMLCGWAMPVLAQDVTKPGRIGVEQAIVLTPGIESASLSQVTVTNTVPIEQDRHERRMNRIWIASLVAMAAASGMDAASSWRKQEGNSLLASPDGTFGAKGMSIKVGIAAGVVLPQVLLRKHKNLKSRFAIGNFAEAAVFSGIAIHNMGIPANR
jgi:ribose/xylose/arabinose/galactoside ABC-type transport system permease subunit